jgi:general secretion pathway protein G
MTATTGVHMQRNANLFIRSTRRGLTLIEIMVVIALLGVLGTVIAVNLTDALDDNSADAAKLQMKQIGSGLQMYALKNKGKYPSTSDGLDGAKKYFAGNKVPSDPWGNEYKYFSPGTHSEQKYELVSMGSDGKEGGEEHAADIKSWELE